MAKRKKKRRKKSNNRFNTAAIFSVLIILTIVLSIQTSNLLKKKNVYAEELAGIEAQLQEQEERADELEQKRIYNTTIMHIEDEARSKLGLVYPDEIILKPE